MKINIIFIILCLFTISCTKPFEKGEGQFSGYVLDENKLPVEGAKVRLLPLSTEIITGIDGFYNFENLPPDVYIPTVSRIDYLFIEDEEYFENFVSGTTYSPGNNEVGTGNFQVSNERGISIIGNSVTFDLNLLFIATPPQATTYSIPNSDIYDSYVIVWGEVEIQNNEEITAYGHCWSMVSEPTVNDFSSNFGKFSGSQNSHNDLFQTKIEDGLVENERLHVRTYATNKYGTNYGEEVTFVFK